MRVLFIGDVVGGAGPTRAGGGDARAARSATGPTWSSSTARTRRVGSGITEKTANSLFDAGADVITTGNHVYRHREVYDYLDNSDRVIRPANYPHANPGRGHTVVEAGGRAGRGDQPQRRGRPAGRPAPLPRGRRDPRADRGRLRDRRLPRRGDQREGRDGLAPRRPRRRRLRHPHPRADRRRQGAAEGAPPSSATSA